MTNNMAIVIGPDQVCASWVISLCMGGWHVCVGGGSNIASGFGPKLPGGHASVDCEKPVRF